MCARSKIRANVRTQHIQFLRHCTYERKFLNDSTVDRCLKHLNCPSNNDLELPGNSCRAPAEQRPLVSSFHILLPPGARTYA
jgi:hypothetical protein